MAYTVFDEYVADEVNSSSQNRIDYQANQSTISLPDETFVRDADLSRDGSDLYVKTNTDTVVIHDYFTQNTPPTLIAPNGTALTPQLVNSFLHSQAYYAEASNSANDASPVGAIQEITGEATITRTNGHIEAAGIGTPIYQGDVIETSEKGAVNIIFVDETTFAVSNDARLAIDEYVFDPSTQAGKTNFSVLKGVFVFTSGLIGREDPDDVEISTPAGSIGIRGTIIAGDVDTGEITVIEGAIVLKDFAGHSLTLSTQFETAKFLPHSGDISHLGSLSVDEILNKYLSVSTVAGDLFSSIQDTSHDINEPDAKTDGQLQENQQNDVNDSDKETENNTDNISVVTSNEIANITDVLSNDNNTEIKTNNTFEPENKESTITSNSIAPLDTLPVVGTISPPFTISIEKFTFSENSSGSSVARLEGQFVKFVNINLTGISQNYFDLIRESDTSFLVTLKAGVAMDFEHPYKLSFVGTNGANTHSISHNINLALTNINESTIPTYAGPNNIGGSNIFLASTGNVWSYNFSQEFADPEHDVANYELVPFSNSNIASQNFNSSTGEMILNFGNVDGTDFTFQVNARDGQGNILQTKIITFDTIEDDANFNGTSDYIDNGTPNILSSGAEIYTTSANTNDSVSVTADDNYIFTNGGNDTLTISSDNNKILTGDGNDTLHLSTGAASNFIFGGKGEDTFNLGVSTIGFTKLYGGDNSDTFVVTNNTVANSLQTESVYVIDGGNDDINNTGNFGDVIRLAAAVTTIDFGLVENGLIKNIETIHAENASAETIRLTYNNVIEMTDSNNILTIDTDNNDSVIFVNTSGHVFVKGNDIVRGAETFETFTDGTITLLIDTEAATVTGF